MNSLQHLNISPLRKRNQFVAMRKGKRQHCNSFLLQMRKWTDEENAALASHGGLRIGFTVTKKVGNAVVRNRVKRRMRELVKSVLPVHGKKSHDYVLIGKRAALDTKFDTMIAELGSALKRIHRNQTSAGKHG